MPRFLPAGRHPMPLAVPHSTSHPRAIKNSHAGFRSERTSACQDRPVQCAGLSCRCAVCPKPLRHGLRLRNRIGHRYLCPT